MFGGCTVISNFGGCIVISRTDIKINHSSWSIRCQGLLFQECLYFDHFKLIKTHWFLLVIPEVINGYIFIDQPPQIKKTSLPLTISLMDWSLKISIILCSSTLQLKLLLAKRPGVACYGELRATKSLLTKKDKEIKVMLLFADEMKQLKTETIYTENVQRQCVERKQ